MEPKNQFATELDHFAQCVRENREPYTPGEEGLQDMRLMQRIYESARNARPAMRDPVTRPDAFRGPRAIARLNG